MDRLRIDAREKNFRTMILANDSSLKEFYVSLAKREKERERRKAQANLPITGRSWDPYARSMIGRVIYGLDVLRKSIFLSLSLEGESKGEKRGGNARFACSCDPVDPAGSGQTISYALSPLFNIPFFPIDDN